MRRSFIGPMSCAAATAAILLLAVAQPTTAHEERRVVGYSVLVGFIGEPFVVADRSGIEITVFRGAAPVLGLQETLKLEIQVPGARNTYDLSARPGSPGTYEARFLVSGDPYKIHLSGDIEVSPVDEWFYATPDIYALTTGSQRPPPPVPAPPEPETGPGSYPLPILVGGAVLVAIGVLVVGARSRARRP